MEKDNKKSFTCVVCGSKTGYKILDVLKVGWVKVRCVVCGYEMIYDVKNNEVIMK